MFRNLFISSVFFLFVGMQLFIILSNDPFYGCGIYPNVSFLVSIFIYMSFLMVKCLPRKPEELGLNLCKPHKKLGMGCTLKTHPWGSGDGRGLVASQYSLLSKLQPVRDSVSKEVDSISEGAPKVVFCLWHECACPCTIIIHVPMCSH